MKTFRKVFQKHQMKDVSELLYNTHPQPDGSTAITVETTKGEGIAIISQIYVVGVKPQISFDIDNIATTDEELTFWLNNFMTVLDDMIENKVESYHSKGMLGPFMTYSLGEPYKCPMCREGVRHKH